MSEFLRKAAAERAEETLGGHPSEIFADVIGVVHGGGGRARRSGTAFVQSLASDRRKR